MPATGKGLQRAEKTASALSSALSPALVTLPPPPGVLPTANGDDVSCTKTIRPTANIEWTWTQKLCNLDLGKWGT